MDHGCFSILLFFLLWNQTNFVNFWWSCLKLKFKTRLKVHIICSFATLPLWPTSGFAFLPSIWVLSLCTSFTLLLGALFHGALPGFHHHSCCSCCYYYYYSWELNFSMHNSLAKSKERMCKGVCEALLWEWCNWDPFLLSYVDNMGTILL